ncbi:hypothetical protein D3C73_1445580 [compost metagenome]
MGFPGAMVVAGSEILGITEFTPELCVLGEVAQVALHGLGVARQRLFTPTHLPCKAHH